MNWETIEQLISNSKVDSVMKQIASSIAEHLKQKFHDLPPNNFFEFREKHIIFHKRHFSVDEAGKSKSYICDLTVFEMTHKPLLQLSVYETTGETIELREFEVSDIQKFFDEIPKYWK